MLDLRAVHRVTALAHTRFEDESLPPELSTAAFNRFDAKAYAPEEIDWGRGAWQARVLDEYRSQVAFTDLLANMTTAGFAFDLLGVGVRVVRDELRHVELCRRMINVLGGSDLMTGDPALVNPSRRLHRLDRILETTVGFLCIGETISVRLLAALRSETSDPLAHAVLTSLTRDESVHSRFGFALLEALMPVLTVDQLENIRATLPMLLAAAEEIVRKSGDGEALHGTNPFGSMSTKRRLEVFEQSIAKDIVPAFVQLGLYRPRKSSKRGASRPARSG